MSVIRYMCAGKCQTKVTVEEFKDGNDRCRAEGCEFYDQEMRRGEYCHSCNTSFEEGEDHICF